MMIPRVFIRAPKQPEVLTEVANPLYAYNFDLNRVEWEKDLEFSWEDMFRDVVSCIQAICSTLAKRWIVAKSNDGFPNNSWPLTGGDDRS